MKELIVTFMFTQVMFVLTILFLAITVSLIVWECPISLMTENPNALLRLSLVYGLIMSIAIHFKKD